MLALYRGGRQAEALQVYQDTRRLLVDELGIEPSQALQRLEQAILRQEESREAGAGRPTVERSVPRRVAFAGVATVLAAAALLAALLITRDDPSPPIHVLGNSLAVISPKTNTVEEQIPVGARPAFVAYGDRSLWVANLDDNSVSRIDPRTHRVVRAIPTDASAGGSRSGPACFG